MIIAFVGDNSFARERAAHEFIDGFIGAHGSHAVDRFAAADIDKDTLGGAVTTTPFLSQRRLVIVRDLGTNKSLAEHFSELVPNVADTTDLVILESRVDGRSKYLQVLKTQTDYREFTHLDTFALVAWVGEYVQKNDGNISRIDAQYLVDRVGTNQQLLSQELEKLLLYSSKINKSSIEALTEYSPQSSIFAMLETAFTGNAQKTIMLYQEQRDQGMEPQAILGMIAWQLHILVLVKCGQDRDPAVIAAKAKLNPFVVRKSANNVKHLTFARLSELIALAANTDDKLKTTKMNADDAVSALLLACTQ